jgi:hypothetical protein
MRTAWLAFLVVGIVDIVLLLEFPIAGLLLLVLAIAGMIWRQPRGAAFAGLVTGVGGTWTGVMVRVKVSCEAFNAVPGQGCEAPGIEGWIGIGVVILVIAMLVTLRVALRGRTRRGA